jgi:hypothetical protein
LGAPTLHSDRSSRPRRHGLRNPDGSRPT